MQPGNFDFALHQGYPLKARWSDRYGVVFMEEDVELIYKSSSEWVVLSPVAICERTQVYLTGKNSTENGIICSCRKDDSVYVLTVSMMAEESFHPSRQEFDPGVLDVDSFLTEEEESKILDSLRDEMPYSGVVHRVAVQIARWLLRASRSGLVRLRQTALVFFMPAVSH